MTKRKTSLSEWDTLVDTPLTCIEDLALPSQALPYRQLTHLFASVYKTKVSRSYKDDVHATHSHVTELMKEKFGNQPIYLTKVLNEFSLDDFHAYLKNCMLLDKIHNRYANVLQSTYKNVLNKAIELKVPNFKRFYLPSSFCYQTRVTERYKPYSKNERRKIDEAIEVEIDKALKLLIPYEKTGRGRAILDDDCMLLEDVENLTLDDARWIFENKMGCIPVTNSYGFRGKRAYRAFYQIIKDNGAYYQNVYESWGVLSKVTMNHLLPFLLKLLKVTGMNVESIYNLEIDDLVDSHPATGKPCLRYWKNRSDGQKLYHLDIFKADLQWLTRSQSEQVKEIFNNVLLLTSKVREKAPLEHKNKLWLFETYNGLIKCLPVMYHLSMAIKTFSAEHELFKQNSNELLLETTRFRPTFISDLIGEGVSIREVQLLMSHKNLYTTMRYLDIHDFGQTARIKIKDKLIELHSNISSSVSSKPHKKVGNKESLPMSTPLATCKNIFDPPESVKSLSNYTPGKPCSTYNMCLSCPNVIITKTDLPKLFAMKRDYLIKIQNSRVLDTPFGHVIKSNLTLLNSILDSNLSEFSAEELNDAEKISLYIETTELI
ncbi:tyrosine-type recombinase/integrase [Pseudoalteromonas neustonica]|uniref:tyrosine-type recombinase/integrase n=1 Tax=Pseudoalteromonas neustonica TaxID=1840331 RepID=UPI0007DB340B|nr:tyrosine-type recombinase/integrase [Pseudoalteromonas neustonica]